MNDVKSVVSNQDGLYKKLESSLFKYSQTTFLRPFASHTLEAFQQVENFVTEYYSDKRIKDRKEVILDSGCGTGESTLYLGSMFKNCPIIGVDKSEARLKKSGLLKETQRYSLDNVFWIRGELIDFWRLVLKKVEEKEWRVSYHALYFPNPWPKEKEAKRRFHLHPIFPTLLKISEKLELRTNWKIYADEFFRSTKIIAPQKKCSIEEYDAVFPVTPFERKYKNANQKLWRVFVF